MIELDSDSYAEKAQFILGQLLAKSDGNCSYAKSSLRLAKSRLMLEIASNPKEYQLTNLGNASEISSPPPRPIALDRLLSDSKLPGVPHILSKLHNAVNSPSATAQEISRIIDLDPALSAVVLKLVNSVSVAAAAPVTSTARALCLLGTRKVYSMAVASCLLGNFTRRSNKALMLHWEHSLACAIIAKDLGLSCGAKDLEELYLCGLLHDIGRLVILVVSPIHYMWTDVMANNKRISVCEAERMLLGYDHAQVAQEFLRRWGLPADIQDVVGQHHAPKNDNQPAALIQVADFLCRLLIVQPHNLAPIETVQDFSWELAKVGNSNLEHVCTNLDANIQATISVLFD